MKGDGVFKMCSVMCLLFVNSISGDFPHGVRWINRGKLYSLYKVVRVLVFRIFIFLFVHVISLGSYNYRCMLL